MKLCQCRATVKCLDCIERDGQTKPKPLVPPVYRCVVDESVGLGDKP